MFFLPPTLGFVTSSQVLKQTQLASMRALHHANFTGFSSHTLGFLWSYPADSQENRGLGGSIAWAWDDSICDRLRPQFSENLFLGLKALVRCEDLKAAAANGFDAWAANSRAISFLDVSEECRARFGNVSRTCPLVEIWVTVHDAAGEEAALAIPITTMSASSSSSGQQRGLFRFTNGDYARVWLGDAYGGGFQPASVLETIGGTISFDVGRCWYIDSEFCSTFHMLKNKSDPNTVRFVGLISVLLISLAAFAVTVYQVVHVLWPHLVWRHQRSEYVTSESMVASRCNKSISVLARWTIVGNSARLILIITPPLFYIYSFMPCFDCFDFEAAAAHEMGHILGLSHPDSEAPGAVNLARNGSAAYDCRHPFDSVHAVDASKTPMNAEATPSVMTSFTQVAHGRGEKDRSLHSPSLATPGGSLRRLRILPPRLFSLSLSLSLSLSQHTPGLCLSADDLAGLNALYPDCSHAMSTPVCTRSRVYLGWIRLCIFIFAPIILALLVAALLSLVTQRHHLRQVQELSTRLASLSKKIRNECDSSRRINSASTDAARCDSTAASSSACMVSLELPTSDSSDPGTPRPPTGRPLPSDDTVQLEIRPS